MNYQFDIGHVHIVNLNYNVFGVMMSIYDPSSIFLATIIYAIYNLFENRDKVLNTLISHPFESN